MKRFIAEWKHKRKIKVFKELYNDVGDIYIKNIVTTGYIPDDPIGMRRSMMREITTRVLRPLHR